MWTLLVVVFSFFLLKVKAVHPIGMAPPVPGLPINTDPTIYTSRSTAPIEPSLSDSYLPAAMQAIAYYVELIQYEPIATTTIEPPFSLSPDGSIPGPISTSMSPLPITSRPTLAFTTTTTTTTTTQTTPFTTSTVTYTTPTTTPTTTTTTTTEKTTITSTPQPNTQSTFSPWYLDYTTPAHKPGYFAPHEPPPHLTVQDPISSSGQTMRPQTGILPILSISNSEFFNWFLQTKGKQLNSVDNEDDLELLDPLPLGLLQDIRYERYEQPALTDTDNINEFRRVYDDFYGRNSPIVGRKKIPPTKFYVHMLMMYDLLKRDAKKMMLNKFEGYSPEMIRILNETSKGSAERQLYTILSRMLERGDVEKADVITRAKSIMEDLANPNTPTAKSMRYLPTLKFLP